MVGYLQCYLRFFFGNISGTFSSVYGISYVQYQLLGVCACGEGNCSATSRILFMREVATTEQEDSSLLLLGMTASTIPVLGGT